MDLKDRKLIMLTSIFNMSRGSLWKVKDAAWKKYLVSFVEKRKLHPGLSLGNNTFNALQDTLPMCIGTSRKINKALKANDVFEHSGKDYQTFFDVLRPVQIPIFEMLGKEPNATPNYHKMMLSPDEMEELDKFFNIKF